MHRDLARLALALDDEQLIARIRRPGEPEDDDWDRGAGGFDRASGLVK